MRRRVHLHGPFKAYHDGPIEVEALTVWDAVEAVTLQIQGFRPHPISGRQRIQVVGHPTIESLKSMSDVEDIHIIPAMTFGKQGGLLQTIIGVTLMVVGFFLLDTPFGIPLMMSGATMALGGVLQMLTPQPILDADNAEEIRSRYLGVTQNTVRIGTTIALLYGRYRVAGQIMSLNVDAKDVTG
jgi:predicted phage tail protein